MLFSRSVISSSFWLHGLQHTNCPSPSPGAYSTSCPLSRWCHPTVSSSIVPFSSWLQSFPISGSFPMSQFFTSGGKIIGASASASVLPMNIQGWFPLGWTGLISLQSKGLSRVFSNTTVQKHQVEALQNKEEVGAKPSVLRPWSQSLLFSKEKGWEMERSAGSATLLVHIYLKYKVRKYATKFL